MACRPSNAVCKQHVRVCALASPYRLYQLNHAHARLRACIGVLSHVACSDGKNTTAAGGFQCRRVGGGTRILHAHQPRSTLLSAPMFCNNLHCSAKKRETRRFVANDGQFCSEGERRCVCVCVRWVEGRARVHSLSSYFHLPSPLSLEASSPISLCSSCR